MLFLCSPGIFTDLLPVEIKYNIVSEGERMRHYLRQIQTFKARWLVLWLVMPAATRQQQRYTDRSTGQEQRYIGALDRPI